jgi:two-component system phosphate regulon response regulator PhoB
MTKILVAEDDMDIRELLALSLEFAGYDVISAADGQQAVDLAFQEKPDLIMLDLRMPRLNGYEALEQIKVRPELEHVPVVILSAKGQDDEIQTGLDLGAIQYILKPFAPDELILKIGQIIAASKETVEETP